MIKWKDRKSESSARTRGYEFSIRENFTGTAFTLNIFRDYDPYGALVTENYRSVENAKWAAEQWLAAETAA